MSLKIQPTSSIKVALGIQENGPVHRYFQNLCYRYMDKYVPRDEGNLRRNVDLSNPNYIIYNSPYAHYIYTGILYVDPITGSSWAKKGVKKIPTGIPLRYHTPGTGKYWDKTMWSAEGKDIIAKVEKYIENGGNNGS